MKIEEIKHIPTRWLALWRAHQNPTNDTLGFIWHQTPEKHQFWDAVKIGNNPYPEKYPHNEWMNEAGAMVFLLKNNFTSIDQWPETKSAQELANEQFNPLLSEAERNIKEKLPPNLYYVEGIGFINSLPEFAKDEMVDVSNDGIQWERLEYLFYAEKCKKHITYSKNLEHTMEWEFCQKITIKNLTIDELRELAAKQLGIDVNQIKVKS